MRNLLPLILFFVFVACKKDTIVKEETPELPIVPAVQTKFDTILPNSYLPVYPGSWWKYINTSTNNIIIDSTGNQYVKDFYTLYNPSGAIVYTSDAFFVPAYYCHVGKSAIDLIWGYKCHYWITGGTSLPFVTIVSDSLPLGTSWQSSRMSGSALNSQGWSMETISTIDTSIQISGNTYYPTIVVTAIAYNAAVNAPAPFPYMRKYFTKDIGLVKIEYMSRPPYYNAYEENIVSYHINK